MGHRTLSLDIGQESKQHFDLTILYFKKNFHLQNTGNRKQKRTIKEKMANKIYLGNENSAIGGSVCNEFIFLFLEEAVGRWNEKIWFSCW